MLVKRLNNWLGAFLSNWITLIWQPGGSGSVTIHLPQGDGALRIWGDLADGGGKLTADVALEDLRIRFGRNLPELDLSSMRGRIEASYKGKERVVIGRKIELQTLDGIRVAPADLPARLAAG